MKRLILITLGWLALATAAFAGSATPFPADWKSWTPMNTTLTGIGALPDCSADVSKLPPIYQKTVETYCAVKPGGPGKVGILVKPSVSADYAARSGKFADGSNMILHLKDMKVLLVSGHKNGAAVYGAFTEDGKDITAASGPLAAETCTTCHTGYQAFCKGGQCGTKK